MNRMLRYAAVAAALFAALGIGTVQAQSTHLRGTLASVADDALVVETAAGELEEFALTDETGVFAVRPASLDEVKQGDFVGITSVEAVGQRVALEAHIFAEELRGLGEGHYPWTLGSAANMMTNATVAKVVAIEAGRTLEVTYEEGEGEQKVAGSQSILVPPEVPVVHLEGAPRTALAAGQEAFLIVDAGGASPITIAVVIGTDGARPPM